MSSLCPSKTFLGTVLGLRLGPQPHRMTTGCRGSTEGRVKVLTLEDVWWGPVATCIISNSLVSCECTMCLGLVDTGAKCSLIYGNPECFPGTPAVIDGYGGKAIRGKKAQIPWGIGRLPPKQYTVYISPIPEHILGVDILQDLWLQTTIVEFRQRVHVVKAVLRGHAKHPPIILPIPPWRQILSSINFLGDTRRLEKLYKS